MLARANGKTNEKFVSEWKWNEAKDDCDVHVLCSWFNIQRTAAGNITGKLEETNMISNGYSPCQYYACSVPMPIFDGEKSLRLSASTTAQLNIFLNLLKE